MINTVSRKSILAILIAIGSILWLYLWHRYGYSRAPLPFPPVSSWLRDAMIIFVPVLLAILAGSALSQWLIGHSQGRLASSLQSILEAFILAVVTSLGIMLIENDRTLLTGIGNQLSFLASICTRLYPQGSFLLGLLKWFIPDLRSLRLHLLLRDGFNLVLVNLMITIIVAMFFEGSFSSKDSYAPDLG